MSLLVTLEEKIGRFAIPNVVRVLAIFQALNWFLIRIAPDFASKLEFDPQQIAAGEVWRLASYVLLPGGDSILWLLLVVPFLWMINDGLEEAWGSFRLNLYLILGLFCVALGGLVSPVVSSGGVLMVTLLFAFAFYFPDQEILLFFILPIKIKWIAFFSAAGLMFYFMGESLAVKIHMFCSVLNFILTFTPGFISLMKHRGEVGERRRRFANATAPEAAFFHQCKVCGKTEVDDPTLDFRVTSEGDEVCGNCRAKA